ncbi:MAG: hypothetical protein ABI880_12475 [Acidobacteriota bacterium]
MTESHEVEWQRLWFTLQTRGWTSLAVVGIDDAKLAVDVANRIAEVGSVGKKSPIRVISALGVAMPDIDAVVSRLAEPVQTIVACDSPRANPAMLPIVHATSGVVLVVRLGHTSLEAVRRTVDGVGRDHVVATVSIG